ncbi:AMP-binding protein, partial [Bacillus velezensis]|uniref:AMP-binding protein n=1 Tax=Bacillus velezensis TaxID=492670 RepID=UPI0011A26251
EMDEGRSNIGERIASLEGYILEEYEGIEVMGIGGEVYVGGEGVGRGYLKGGELRGEKFVEEGFGGGEKM